MLRLNSRQFLKRILFLAAWPTFVASPADAAAPVGYEVVWEDNFDNDTLDTQKWFVSTKVRDFAQQTGDAIKVSQGALHIRTFTENEQHYTGFLSTQGGRFNPTYGYFEARIKFLGAPGEHCAFWLQSPEVGKHIGDNGSAGMEIDVVEHRLVSAKNKPIDNLLSMNLHWDGYASAHQSAGGKWEAPGSLNNTWHTYGLLWTEQGYTFYLDDVERWHSRSAVSHGPEYLLLTCEVKQAGWAGTPPARRSGYGNREDSSVGMAVDWVRAWQMPGH